MFVMIQILLVLLHVEDGFQTRNFRSANNHSLRDDNYIILKFYKNSIGQVSNLLFLANRSEHSWRSFPPSSRLFQASRHGQFLL